MLKTVCILLSTLLVGNLYSQVLLTTTYLEDFGSTDIVTWTDNTTITGWYATDVGASMHVNVTAAAPTNTGRFYSYECSGDNDQKIGSRASGGTGIIYYGVRVRNNSGSDIDYLLVEFDWYQFSLAQNGSNVNTITFSYQQAATITSLTAGAWTNHAALDFTAPQSSAACCASQIQGYPCTEGGSNSSCITVNIPAGEEIMLRFVDGNDAANDHHMGIDNFFVGIATDATCAFILSTEVLNFKVHQEGKDNILNWSAKSDIEMDKFEIERSRDGESFQKIGEVGASALSSIEENFSYIDKGAPTWPLTYYRIKSLDANGEFKYSEVRSVIKEQIGISYSDGFIDLNLGTDDSDQIYNVYSLTGQLISTGKISGSSKIPWHTAGVFIVELPELGEREKITSLGSF